MFHIFFLFIPFPVYSLDVRTCYRRQNPIYIIKVKQSNYENESNKKTIEKLNNLTDVLYNKCQPYYDIKIRDVADLQKSLSIAASLVKKGRSFINLFGYDRLHLKLNEDDIIDAGFIYDNNINEPLQFKSNYSVHVTEYDQPVAKIMSKSVYEMNSGDLFYFVTELQFCKDQIYSRESCLSVPTPNELKTVHVFLDDLLTGKLKRYLQNFCPSYITVIVKSTELLKQCKSSETCEKEIDKLKKNSLAVLAPTPFEIGIEFTVPTLFFNTPQLYSELISQFPNSINLLNGNVLKYGFMRFIKNMGWRRVAILSDDALFSDEFENELLQMFQQEGIIYNSQRCESDNCNFKKAFRNLESVHARILIVNVDEKNLHKIINETKNKKMFTLLYRVWSPEITSLFGPGSSQSFFIHLSPRKPEDIKEILVTIEKTIQKLHIVQDLKSVTRKDFFRQFVTAINQNMKLPLDETVCVRNEMNELVSEMAINNSNGVINEKKYISINAQRDQHCLFETNKFEEICDYYVIIYFMSVVVLFFVFLLVITCYFHKTSPVHDVNYTQF